MSWIPGSEQTRRYKVEFPRRRVAAEVSRWDSTPDICDLIDSLVLHDGTDEDVAGQLVSVEVWCAYLRQLLRDTGRDFTRAAIVANQTALPSCNNIR